MSNSKVVVVIGYRARHCGNVFQTPVPSSRYRTQHHQSKANIPHILAIRVLREQMRHGKAVKRESANAIRGVTKH